MNFFTLSFFIKLIMAFITSAGFAMMFNTNKRHLVYIGICGLGNYAIYYTVLFFLPSSWFWAGFLSAVFTAIFAEVIARVVKAPTIIFLLTGIVPTVPGGSLYYSVRNLLLNNVANSIEKLTVTLMVGIGIAGGIVFVSIVFGTIMDFLAKKKNLSKK